MKIQRYLDQLPLSDRFRIRADQWIIPPVIKFEIQLDRSIRENIKLNKSILTKSKL